MEPIIRQSTEVAEKAIDAQFVRAVEEARTALHGYSDRYIRIMDEEIKAKGDSRTLQQRAKIIEGDMKRVEGLVGDTKECRQLLARIERE